MRLNDYRLLIDSINQVYVNAYTSDGQCHQVRFVDIDHVPGLAKIGYIDHENIELIVRDIETSRVLFVHPHIAHKLKLKRYTWKDAGDHVSEIYHSQGWTQAVNLLVVYNALAGERRCYGLIAPSRSGVPTYSYCNKHKCWVCGGAYQEIKRQQIVLGTMHLNHVGDAWFITVHHKKATNTRSQKAKDKFISLSNKMLRRIKDNAKSLGLKLEYCLALSGKDSSNEIHTHIICNHASPDIRHAPTKNRIEHYRSKSLDDLANSKGLRVFIEKTIDPKKVGNYVAVNLEKGRSMSMADNQKAIRFSQGWIKPSSVEDEPIILRKLLDRNISRGDLVAGFGDELMKIDRSFAVGVLLLGGNLFVLDESHECDSDHAPSLYNDNLTKTPIFIAGIPHKYCRGCGSYKPLNSDTFCSDKSNALGYESQCKDCRQERDRLRYQDFDRRVDMRCYNANDRAWCGNKLDSAEIKSRWVNEYCDCHYCDKPLHQDDEWELDHGDALVKHQGLNVNDNIFVCCPECHELKTKSGLNGDGYLATIGKPNRYGIVQKLLPLVAV